VQEKAKILIVDDEKVIRDGCERALDRDDYEVVKAGNGEQGIALLEEGDFNIVLLDLMMPGLDGFAVLEWIKDHRPYIEVIVITGFATVEKAVTAMKQGAFDFIGKPFTPDYIRVVVAKAIHKQRLEGETARLREEKSQDLLTIAVEKSRLNTVFSCMEEAVIVTSRDGTVVLHNQAAIRVLQIQTDPVIGKSIEDTLRDPELIKMIRDAVDQGDSITREFPPNTISRLFLRARTAPVRTTYGKVLGAVTVFEDITNLKQVDRHKSEFVAMVAHELRAPLASIEQMIYVVRDGLTKNEPEKQAQIFERICVRLSELLNLIENLLDLSKLETGTYVFNMENLCLDDMLCDLSDIFRPQAEKKEIDLDYQPCGKDWHIVADRDQIRQVFSNVIGNAVKYSSNGSNVTISARTNGILITVEISDSGPGISEQDQQKIFEKFFRARGKTTRGVTGSGLGLSVAREIVNAHKGEIEVSSQIGHGTKFTITLPQA
jgi:PAS domain S-box-containing protein